MTRIDRLLQRWRISKVQPFISPGARVLDIGCADGELFRRLVNVGEGVGIDPDLPSSTPQIPNTVLLKGLFPDVIGDSPPFDVITLLAVLEHVPPEPQRKLACDCARHLKVGGHLVITVPSPVVDHILSVMRFVRLIHGMALEQHYGYDPQQTVPLFSVGGLEPVKTCRFQLGLNHLFVFKKNTPSETTMAALAS